MTMPGPPYRLGATPARRRGPAPRTAATSAHRRPREAPSAPVDRARTNAPFAGLRVVDLGSFWAGPYCTMYLGALGAEVIKVESTRRPDGFRFSGAVPEMGDDWYERGGIFAATNLNKREVTLELSTAAGRDLLLRLVEGRRRRARELLGARRSSSSTSATTELRVVRPGLIMVRMPGFGLEGPWRDYVGWAMVIEQATGMASVTGPPDLPMHPGGLADPVIGMHAAVAIQAALEHRARTGEGQLIEIAQLETGANLTAELVIEWSMHRDRAATRRESRPAPRTAGRVPVPGRRRCSGMGRDDDQRRSTVAGARGRARPRRLDRRRVARDADGRQRAAHRARRGDRGMDDRALRGRDRRGAPIARDPRRQGAPGAGDVRRPAARRRAATTRPLDHAKTGVRRYPGWPMRFSFAEAHHRRGAPTLGQHNREILTELGVGDDEIARLAEDGVIGDRMQVPG